MSIFSLKQSHAKDRLQGRSNGQYAKNNHCTYLMYTVCSKLRSFRRVLDPAVSERPGPARVGAQRATSPSFARKQRFEMRAAIVAIGWVLCSVPACPAMPVASFPVFGTAIQVHGCHHYYADDITGWHRHYTDCRIARGLAGAKGSPR